MSAHLTYETIAVFTDPKLAYRGNPSAVVFTEKALGEPEMQEIASQLRQPATTFLYPSKNAHTFYVRWFAPDAEIELCGHGAAAAIVYIGEKFDHQSIKLIYGNGELHGNYHQGQSHFALKISPIPVQEEILVPQPIMDGLGIPILAMYATANKHIILTDSEESIRKMQPDFARLRDSEFFGYAVTAQGNQVDFVSRTLVPHVQQLEDFATGSSHAMLAPFWVSRLGKRPMVAHQLSARGGVFHLSWELDQLVLGGTFDREGQGVI
jgi:PhzF family phenazine biosynthesis protein